MLFFWVKFRQIFDMKKWKKIKNTDSYWEYMKPQGWTLATYISALLVEELTTLHSREDIEERRWLSRLLLSLSLSLFKV
jgi:hypothetical protein